jgi:hypothetical protein
VILKESSFLSCWLPANNSLQGISTILVLCPHATRCLQALTWRESRASLCISLTCLLIASTTLQGVSSFVFSCQAPCCLQASLCRESQASLCVAFNCLLPASTTWQGISSIFVICCRAACCLQASLGNVSGILVLGVAEDDGMDIVDAGANTLLTIESPRETHLSFADGSPAQGAIPPLLARGSYFIGSPTPKPPFLVNSTFPAVCTHYLIPSVMCTRPKGL